MRKALRKPYIILALIIGVTAAFGFTWVILEGQGHWLTRPENEVAALILILGPLGALFLLGMVEAGKPNKT